MAAYTILLEKRADLALEYLLAIRLQIGSQQTGIKDEQGDQRLASMRGAYLRIPHENAVILLLQRAASYANTI